MNCGHRTFLAVVLVAATVMGGSAGTAPPGRAHAVLSQLLAPLGSGMAALAGDPGDSRPIYRVHATPDGQIVQESTDGGAQWTTLLTPSRGPQGSQSSTASIANPRCVPARYAAVRSLVTPAGGNARLFIATAGTPGNYLDGGCSSAVGGVYAGSGPGTVAPLGTDGLPFAQDPAGRTIRAYDVDSVTVAPSNSAVLYVHASGGTGPESPPAGLYRTTDGGTHWTEIDRGLQPSTVITNSASVAVPVYDAGSLTVSPADAQRLTFRNDTGAYLSTNGGTDWLPAPGTAAARCPCSASSPSVVGKP